MDRKQVLERCANCRSAVEDYQLRAEYPAVKPGYHTNKRHWNTITLDGTVDATDIPDMIGHSYELVVAGLTKKQRSQLG